ncbi:MAG: prepilin-type N-terminal cleavage/methylation domain-containing protein [Clostridiales bacterium]|nr:prepilin-type N-terminal cleavage/methylation domain-containing protein [Clostridiales bacterium]
MRKLNKSKKGVTLVETVMVLAIIVILASSFIFGAFKIFNNIKTLLIGDDTTSISASK